MTPHAEHNRPGGEADEEAAGQEDEDVLTAYALMDNRHSLLLDFNYLKPMNGRLRCGAEHVG